MNESIVLEASEVQFHDHRIEIWNEERSKDLMFGRHARHAGLTWIMSLGVGSGV